MLFPGKVRLPQLIFMIRIKTQDLLRIVRLIPFEGSAKECKILGLLKDCFRINAYRALASPSLIALSSKDPIITAFQVSGRFAEIYES